MTKKKYSRPKHQKDISLGDTSEEEFNTVQNQGKSCPHVTRGIHFGRVKKSLKSTQSIVSCSVCTNENSNEELPEVWLCLQCGHRGCGRMSENKHGLMHFKTLHSDCHSLVLSTSSGSVWCYECDDEISLQSSHILKQCVEFVMKMIPNDSNASSVPSVNKFAAQKGLQNSVIKEETVVQNAEENGPVEKNNKSVKNVKENSQKIPIKGLRNLGNTCFFNAVMQNLNQTPLLYHELKNTCTPSHMWQVPELFITNNEITESDSANIVKLSLPRQLPLTNGLLNFFEQMTAVSSAKVDVVNPTQLFGEISKKCPQFRHFQQQDSHELLRQLLDGVRQEEIKRQKKAILKYFDLENVSPENVDEDMKKQIKAYGCYASHTIIEKVFGGLLISTVLCEECKTSSQVFEPFMDLSLPLFEEKQQESNEQLCGMLDGGKQDHIKPLRNKKVDLESDDNVQGEYVLTKPKNDLGKPSKHQEKKQKQLAKKEKKRSKNIARNKKIIQNELSDNNEINEAKDGENEEDINKDIEKPDDADNESEDTLEVPELVEDREGDSKEDSELTLKTSHSNVEINGEKSSLPDIATTPDTEDISINDKSLISHSQTDEIMDADPLELQNVKFEDNSNQLAELEIADDADDPLDAEDKELDNVSDVDVMEQNEKTERTASQVDGEETGKLKEDTDESTENQNAADDLEKSVENEEITEAVDVPNPDDSVCSLTEEFNNHLKMDSCELNLDVRIHALSMQVKDVRIRRDSDRQENLLNSSESPDDWESQKTNCTSPKSSIEDSCSVENGDNWSHSVSEEQTKDWISKTLTTLKPRHHVSPLECSVNSCLSHFTKPELLTGNNKFRCENCTQLKIKKTGNKKDIVYSNASKQMLIFSPPAVLTLHLKRFQQVGMSLRKVNRFVEFPLVLDLSPYCCSACSILPHMSSVDDEILYSLYGIVEHSGRLTSGHYTAYVKANKRTVNRTFECQLPLAQCDLQQLLRKFSGANRESSQNNPGQTKEDSQWFYISDSHVREVSVAQVLKCQAYLLFYERIK